MCRCDTLEPEWLPAPDSLSDEAARYRDIWSVRWPVTGSMDPELRPSGMVRHHLPLTRPFRSPLTFAEELRTAAQYFSSAVRRLAGTGSIVVLTFEWKSLDDLPAAGEDAIAEQPDHEPWIPRLLDVLPEHDQELWLSTIETDCDGDRVVEHSFRTVLALDDPRLPVVLARASEGDLVVVTDPDLR